ncbi:hypothetical protein DL96DRAFT_1678249 [Flagelloscypha sp. PMI_526]|nr:hypothetical protein DL96DRAFT_1678249 [Flagelloscypha sp. PMI_526]
MTSSNAYSRPSETTSFTQQQGGYFPPSPTQDSPVDSPTIAQSVQPYPDSSLHNFPQDGDPRLSPQVGGPNQVQPTDEDINRARGLDGERHNPQCCSPYNDTCVWWGWNCDCDCDCSCN